MELKLDLTKEYGLVLEGGGAKGSYQIGAWKALREAKVRIKGISGASVGALNGAMIAMDDLATAEYIWDNISYSRVMDVDDTVMEHVQRREFKSAGMTLLAAEAKKVLKEKGLDITPLRELIESTIDEEKIRTSGRELYITAYSVSDRCLLTMDVRDIREGDIGDMLMASAYLPLFKSEKLGGKRYLDGGGWDNVPISALLDRGYEDIIVLRIYGLGFDSEKVTRIPEGVHVCHIAPRQSLGGLLKFDKRQAHKNMKLGYYDGLRMLYGLKGRWYYLDAPEPEEYYMNLLVKQTEIITGLLPCELTAGQDREKGVSGLRYYTEFLYPRLAKKWKMKDGWNYKDMYLGIMEYAARRRRINRFKVYRAHELLEKICLHDYV